MSTPREPTLKLLILILAVLANLIFRTLNWQNSATIVFPPVATCLPVQK